MEGRMEGGCRAELSTAFMTCAQLPAEWGQCQVPLRYASPLLLVGQSPIQGPRPPYTESASTPLTAAPPPQWEPRALNFRSAPCEKPAWGL